MSEPVAYLTNVDVFRSIAIESYAAMRESTEKGRRPKPDGSGFIVTLDTYHTSFRHACVAVAFAAMYFEALVYLFALRKFGEIEARKIDRMPYEKRLAAIGLQDEGLLQLATDFRNGRKELVHEKALELGQAFDSPPKYAQYLAQQSIDFIARIDAALSVA